MNNLGLVCRIDEVIGLVFIIPLDFIVIVLLKGSFAAMNQVLRFELRFLQCNFQVAFIIADASFMNLMAAVNAFVFSM